MSFVSFPEILALKAEILALKGRDFSPAVDATLKTRL